MPDTPAEPKAAILLVDDRPANLLALEAILTGLGAQFVRAGSGEEALAALAGRDFAAVLLDVRMPGLDGFETARRIRGRERSRATPVIFLTADESPDFPVAGAYALGAVDYLVKPLVPEILRAKVAAFVELFAEKERARRQADQLRMLVQATTDYAIFLLDPEGRVASWNAGAERIKGYAAGEIIGQHFSRFYPQEAVARGWPAHELEVAGRDGRFEDEGWRVRKDGSTFWANVVITALRDEHGRLHGFSKVTRDLTERKRAEDALRASHDDLERRVEERTAELRRSEEQFRTLADSIPQLAWMARPDGAVEWFNRRWYEYTGAAPTDSVGRGWEAALDPADARRVLAAWRAALAAGGPWEDTFLLRRHDGAARWHLGRAVPVRDEAGRVARWFGTNTDVTDRVEAEAALRDAGRRKDEFLAVLAHELRNPLAPVLTSLNLLGAAGADQGAAGRARAMIERQVRHLTRLVDDLLDVSRITRGAVQVRRERLDLAALIRTAAEDRRPVVEAAGMRLEVEAPDAPVWVAGDPTRLTQVLNNLLDNAVKFRNGGDRVTVRLDAEADRVVLTVSDRGIGIGPEQFPRLFDPVSQADRSLDRSRGGLGLGLSLVKGLVELHGGEVSAASGGLGRGATFVVRLPLKHEASALADAPAAPQPAPKPVRILIVEDNQDAADSLQALLELLGHTVAVAYTGPDGVRLAREWRPDVVLCDIGLPGLDGYGVAGELRHDPATAGARLIAVTGYGQDEDRRRTREAGFDHHLVKPVDPAALGPLLVRPA